MPIQFGNSIKTRNYNILKKHSFASVLEKNPKVSCIKIDIEGSEIDILTDYKNVNNPQFWGKYGISKLVFEYLILES